MTAESNTKFMETALSQKITFFGLIILIFTVITSMLGVASIHHNVLYIYWDMVYIIYEQCELPATTKGSCRISRDVWLAEQEVG